MRTKSFSALLCSGLTACVFCCVGCDKAAESPKVAATPSLSPEASAYFAALDKKSADMRAAVARKYSEKKRHSIFNEMWSALDRSGDEADKKFPRPSDGWGNHDKYIKDSLDFGAALDDKYTNAVAKKYGLTDAELSAINFEGIEKKWPTNREQR